MWEKLEFEVKPYKEIKDLFVLGDVSEVVASLDDSLVGHPPLSHPKVTLTYTISHNLS